MSSIDLTPPRPDHPWLAEFAAAPDPAFDAVIRGEDIPFPYGRGEGREALALLFGGLGERDPLRRLLDDTVGAWIDRRRQDPPEMRGAYGIDRYARELSDALHLVHRLELTGTAARLVNGYFRYLSWLKPLRLNPARDPLGAYWTVLAHFQKDRRFLSRWFHLCEEAGRERSSGGFGKVDITIALLGLRSLPDEAGQPPAVEMALAGLARWGARLGGQDAGRFRRQWLALRALYPRGPDFWGRLVPPLLRGRQELFAEWWRSALPASKGGKTGVALSTPPLRSVQDMLKSIGREPVEKLRPDIERLIDDQLHYAEATGESHYVVRTACNIGDRVLLDAPDLTLRLAHIAVHWEPANPFGWTLWSKALLALGQDDLAELLLWESIRRFPDDVVSRNALAELLGRSGREAESEALYRQTMSRFPDNVVSRSALAELLGRSGREAEAEALYRQTMVRFSDDVVSRDALARLLIRIERPDDAEAVIREVARLDGRRVAILRIALGRARRGEEPFPAHEERQASATGAVSRDGAAEAVGDDGRVMRVDFRLGPALDGLAEPERDRLRAEAEAELRDLLDRRPDHAGAQLLTLRRTAAADRAVRWAALAEVFPNDYGLRLDAAREADEGEVWESLLRDFPRRRPLTWLARVRSADEAVDAEGLEEVERWLADAGEDGCADDAVLSTAWRLLTGWRKKDGRPLAESLSDRGEALEGLLDELVMAAVQEAVPLVAEALPLVA